MSAASTGLAASGEGLELVPVGQRVELHAALAEPELEQRHHGSVVFQHGDAQALEELGYGAS